jgi:hypothetical protein
LAVVVAVVVEILVLVQAAAVQVALLMAGRAR